MARLLYAACLLGLLMGCKSEGKIDPDVENLGRADGPMEMPVKMGMEMQKPEAPEEEPVPVIISGRVLETIDASRYTYIRVQADDGEEVWTAVPQVKLIVGQPVAIVQSIVMKDFESKTLYRTFPYVVFGVLEGQSEGVP